MKLLLGLLAFSGILLNDCYSQSSVWRVTGDGNEMYIGGTVHLLKDSDYPLPKEYEEAYAHADVLVFEADLEKMEDPSLATQMMAKMVYQDGRTLDQVLNKKVYEKLNKACEKMGLPLANMNQFKPAMVILTMTNIKMKGSGMTAEGIDKHYYAKGKTEEKGLAFLESVDSQLELLANMGEGNENEFIEHSLEDLDNMEKGLADLISNWREGSSESMQKQIEEMQKDYPKLYQDLLVKRNNNWMPTLEKYLSSVATEYVLFGALHLHGPDGILEQLKAKGYRVEQL